MGVASAAPAPQALAEKRRAQEELAR